MFNVWRSTLDVQVLPVPPPWIGHSGGGWLGDVVFEH